MRPRSDTRLLSTDMDEIPVKPEPRLDFDLRAPFPEKYEGQRFGPALIDRSLKAGNYVIAEIFNIDGQFPVTDARWDDVALQVLTVNGWRIPSRLFTLTTLKGFKL